MFIVNKSFRVLSNIFSLSFESVLLILVDSNSILKNKLSKNDFIFSFSILSGFNKIYNFISSPWNKTLRKSEYELLRISLTETGEFFEDKKDEL